jgi:hypothetical protein
MRMSDWENIAAAVLEVGRFEQSPAAQMLGYFFMLQCVFIDVYVP